MTNFNGRYYSLDDLKDEIIRMTKLYNKVSHGRGGRSSLELTEEGEGYYLSEHDREALNNYYLVMAWDSSACMFVLDAEDWKNTDWKNSSNWEDCGRAGNIQVVVNGNIQVVVNGKIQVA